MAEIIYPEDNNFSNNFAQKTEMYAPASSPATFEFLVYNPTYLQGSANVSIRIAQDASGSIDTSGLKGWTHEFSHKSFKLEADDCPQVVTVTLNPLQL